MQGTTARMQAEATTARMKAKAGSVLTLPSPDLAACAFHLGYCFLGY